LVLQHPETAHPDVAGDQMRETLDALSEVDAEVVLVYPNSDAGSHAMIDVIESHPVREDMTVVENLPRREFLGIMARADVMVGNSSSGIIEAPSFGLPVVNIGSRQTDRERSENVVDVDFDADELVEAITRCLTDESLRERARESENPYDYGGASSIVVDRLKEISIDDRLLQKRITY
jgi:UDP-hydrolysing UDP-N-acetyl-D-glucosamine 2-epimerase